MSFGIRSITLQLDTGKCYSITGNSSQPAGLNLRQRLAGAVFAAQAGKEGRTFLIAHSPEEPGQKMHHTGLSRISPNNLSAN